MTTQETRNTLKFTQMCRYFRANRCHMGNECNFAHSPEELRKAPSLVGTKLCFQFSSKGQCSKGAACNFAHGKEELQSMPVEARSPVGRKGGMDPMKVKAAAEVKAVKVQGPRDACDAISKMHLLQMKMNQLESLSMRLAVRPPPGLEAMNLPMSSFTGSLACMHSEIWSMASTSFPSSPRVDESESEMFSSLLSDRSEAFWL